MAKHNKKAKSSQLPRKVIIAGEVWTVRRNPKNDGGWICANKTLIEVGIKSRSPQRIREIFLHELCEAILVSRMLRYQKAYDDPCNGDYIFVFNHAEFENVIRDLNIATKDL